MLNGPADRRTGVVPGSPIGVEHRIVEINNLLIFPVTLSIVWIPNMAITQIDARFLKGSGQAAGT